VVIAAHHIDVLSGSNTAAAGFVDLTGEFAGKLIR
jgi:hypothetical protein